MNREEVDERLVSGRLTIDLQALVRNWKWLAANAPNSAIAMSVKADGYGLGLPRIGDALAQAGCRHFFTANPLEGTVLRRVTENAEIFILSGLTEKNAAHYNEASLTPVLNSLEDIDVWANWCRKSGHRRPCAIHIDTGMNRLGLTPDEALRFIKDRQLRHSVTENLILSHLACADESDHSKNFQQLKSFNEVASHFEGSRKSLANSAGIVLGEDYQFDICRAGIAVYGGEFSDIAGPLEPVAKLEGRIVQIRNSNRGETVGYGGTAKLEKNTRIAIVGIGYGDGVHRAASGSGVAMRELNGGTTGWIGGHVVPAIGRISMDLTAFDVSHVPESVLEENSWIEFFGENVPLADFSKAAGSIDYEVLTGIAPRVHRVYKDTSESNSNG